MNEGSVLGDGEGKALLAQELLKSSGKDWVKIATLLEQATKKGAPLGHYLYGKLLARGYTGVTGNCKIGHSYVKIFVESVAAHDSDLFLGEDAYLRGMYDTALVHYAMASERGYLVAQLNSAVLLDDSEIEVINLLEYASAQVFWNATNPYELALPLYLRAANQGHIDSRVRVGDLYYYGFTDGNEPIYSQITPFEMNHDEMTDWSLIRKATFYTSRLPLAVAEYLTGFRTKPNYALAAVHYSNGIPSKLMIAAEGEFQASSIAMFNLGWMYEYGLGVAQDYHLAKRWYDLSKATNPGAFLPVIISTTILQLKWTLSDVFSFIFGSKYSLAKPPPPRIPDFLPGEDPEGRTVVSSPKEATMLNQEHEMKPRSEPKFGERPRSSEVSWVVMLKRFLYFINEISEIIIFLGLTIFVYMLRRGMVEVREEDRPPLENAD